MLGLFCAIAGVIVKQIRPEVNPYELSYLIDNYVRTQGELPTDSFVVKVNKENCLAQGMKVPAGYTDFPEYMSVKLKTESLTKSERMVYEMLGRNDWKRPIYMSVTLGQSNYAGLENYCILEGLAYRLTPFNYGRMGTIDADVMYDNMMNRFAYGNVNTPGIYLDETVSRMCVTHRRMLLTLANQLRYRGDTEKAINVLTLAKEKFPSDIVPYDFTDDADIALLWHECGKNDEAIRVASELLEHSVQQLHWLSSLSDKKLVSYGSSCVKSVRALFAIYQLLDSLEAVTPEQAALVDNVLATSAARYGYSQLQ